MKKYKTFIKHTKNPDISNGGYWSKIKRPNNVTIIVDSLPEAKDICLKFIEKYNIGGGNWYPAIITENNIQIATISYNGRIWDTKHIEITSY